MPNADFKTREADILSGVQHVDSTVLPLKLCKGARYTDLGTKLSEGSPFGCWSMCQPSSSTVAGARTLVRKPSP